MALINLSNAYLSFSDHPLLDHTELYVEANERVCLVGRNGAGKSTLMKIIAGEIPLDDGQVQIEKGVHIARLEQDPPRHIQGTIFDYVAEGIAHLAVLLKEYHHISQQLLQDTSEKLLDQLAKVQTQLEHENGWQFDSRIHETLLKLGLEADMPLSDGGGR